MRRLGWVVVVGLGCGPIVAVGETDAESSGEDDATATTATTTSTTTVGTSSSSTSTTATTTSASTTASTTDEPPPPPGSYCQAACEVPMDCCVAFGGDPSCMGNFGSYPWRFTCEDGACKFGGCETDEECSLGGVLPTYLCIPQDGIAVCQPGCSQDMDCEDQFLTGWLCTNGIYCTPPPCVDDISCGVGSVCDTNIGQCIPACDNDDICGGLGVCDLDTGQCVCTSEDQCMDGFTCAP